MSPRGRSTCVVKRASFVFVFVAIDAPLHVPVLVSIPVEVPVRMAIILIIGYSTMMYPDI
jgi:hypothetical protein